MGSVKIGDLINIRGNHVALVIDIEPLYPRHPQSPPRNFIVQFIATRPNWAVPHFSGKPLHSVNAFAVTGIVNERR